VFSTNDQQILQVLGLLEEEIEDLTTRHTWQAMNFEKSHTTIAAENQGNINTLCPGFGFIRNNTIWDDTDKLPVIGPMNGQEWQALKAVAVNGPRFQFRFLGNNLLVNPIPAAGHAWKWEYESAYGITDQASTPKQFFTADTDLMVLPEQLHLLGLRWRWMREKGLAYSELFNSYELQVKDAMGRDGGAKRLFADETGHETKPGIFVPNGNWTVP